MENIKLNNGIEMPVLGLGTWQLKGDECVSIVKKALELGYRHIDTAEIYMNEKKIGQAIKGFDRKKLFITSKVFPYHMTYNGIINAFESSLSKLETDYLDLYLIHWPSKIMNLNKLLSAFKKLHDEKKLRAIGVSNFTIDYLKKAIKTANELKIQISVNQVEFHPFLYQKKLLDFCNQNKITITAYSPLARGEINENETIKKIAKEYKRTPAQISLRWLLQKGLVVIPKASSEKHLSENMNIFNFELKGNDVERIDNIIEEKRFINPPFANFDKI